MTLTQLTIDRLKPLTLVDTATGTGITDSFIFSKRSNPNSGDLLILQAILTGSFSALVFSLKISLNNGSIWSVADTWDAYANPSYNFQMADNVLYQLSCTTFTGGTSVTVLGIVGGQDVLLSTFQSPNVVLASPDGASGFLSPRALVVADIAGAGAAGVSGNIQANNGGALAGIPGSTVDFANGLTGLAPTGTGIALTLMQDSSNDPALLITDQNGTIDGQVNVNITPGAHGIHLTSITAEADDGGTVVLLAQTGSVDFTGTDASGGSIEFASGGGLANLSLIDSSGASIDLQPALGVAPPQYTVATLPAPSTEGYIAYATNGRKVGEGAGAGTGVVVYFSNGSWRVFSTDLAVAA